jgi:hypothetical protein
VLPVPTWSLRRYVAEAKLLPDMARRICCVPADSGAAMFAACGCNLRFDSRSKFTSPHAKTSVLAATVKGFAMGVTGGMQGDPRQQGGCFILAGPGAAAAATLDSDSAAAAAASGGAGGESAPAVPATPAAVRTVWAHLDRHNADQVPIPAILSAAGLPADLYTQPAHT